MIGYVLNLVEGFIGKPFSNADTGSFGKSCRENITWVSRLLLLLHNFVSTISDGDISFFFYRLLCSTNFKDSDKNLERE